MRDGVVLLGHIQSIQGYQVALTPEMKENLSKADKFEVDFVKQIDEYIESNGVDAPIEKLPELRDGYDTREILALDLESASITTVIWATGYKFDFDLVKMPAFEEDGYPRQKHGVTEFPGLYFVGLPFLHTVKSGLLVGVGDDAAHVAGHIDSRPKI
jgi:putative flavoprotein involved in K+ transport